MSGKVMLKVENLKKHFGKTKAVDGISFSLKEGEIVGFLGPNGAGKTTTIRTIMDFLRPDEGSIKIMGKVMRESSAHLKESIGYLSAEGTLYENWTGREHIDLVENLRGRSSFTNELIKKLNYDPTKKVSNLSTGNKQKLSLILSLLHEPKILIMDEPTTGLDPLLQEVIYEILKEQASKGTAIFLSSHNLSEVERVCDRVVIIKRGKLIDDQKITSLKKKRLYMVNLYFSSEKEKLKFSVDGFEIVTEYDQGYSLRVKGDITNLLAKISKYKLKDIEIKHANLEDIFMEFYRNDK